MSNKSKNYSLKRFFLMVSVSTFAAILILFFLSVGISVDVYSKMNQNDIKPYLEKGQELVGQYKEGEYTREQLQALLNPQLDLSSDFLILIDTDNSIIAAKDSGLEIVNTAGIPAITAQMKQDRYLSVRLGDEAAIPTIMVGTAVRHGDEVIGYVIAGKNLGQYADAAKTYKYNLLIVILPILIGVLVPGYFISRRMSKPTEILKTAALQLAGGDLHVKIRQDLKGEMGEIAVAFNYMSERLSETISELQYQKNSIELILEGLSEGIIAMDVNYEIIRENRAVVELFGNRDAKEYVFVKEEVKKCILSQVSKQGKIKAGNRVLQYVVTNIMEDNLQQVGAVALVRDITENERLEKTRHDYVANISHELRTPLSSMRGLIEGLRDGLVIKQSDKQRYYAILSGEVMRLSRLVNDLLELSGLQSSTAAFELEKIDIKEMLMELHDRYKKMFEEHRMEFILEMQGMEKSFILSNEDRLTQVLTIFLDNAIKYTPEGGRTVLGAKNEGDGIYLFVRDNGKGIGEDNTGKIFDRFYQAEISRSEKGNGLGLSIAKEILDKLDLIVYVKSQPGEGSEFGFVVPVIKPGIL